MPLKVKRDAFLRVTKRLGNSRQIAQALGVTSRAVEQRIVRERKLGTHLPMFGHNAAPIRAMAANHKARQLLRVDDGIVLVGSDAHIWPGPLTTAQRAFIKFAKLLKPKAIILNGDVMDGQKINRHPRIGFLEKAPTVQQEIEAIGSFLGKVRASGDSVGCGVYIWTLGNHDLIFESRLAAMAPEYEGVKGMHLKDHFPDWTPCWSVHLNKHNRAGYTVIKHRWHNGTNAKHSNTVKAGTHMVTGHLHALGRADWSNFIGDFYGVDCGTLAQPYAPQFVHYTEDNAVNWRSGYPVLTYHKGRLLQPEFVKVYDKNHVEFRGEIIKV